MRNYIALFGSFTLSKNLVRPYESILYLRMTDRASFSIFLLINIVEAVSEIQVIYVYYTSKVRLGVFGFIWYDFTCQLGEKKHNEDIKYSLFIYLHIFICKK